MLLCTHLDDHNRLKTKQKKPRNKSSKQKTETKEFFFPDITTYLLYQPPTHKKPENTQPVDTNKMHRVIAHHYQP
jgi:hypothetical protein